LGWILLLVFIGVPLIEIAVFIQVGGWLGLAPTLLIVIATAVIGTALLRRQGLATLARARENMAQGTLPVVELFDGLCLLLAGALLLTPGFFTDALGAVLLVPAFRNVLRIGVAARLFANAAVVVNGQPVSPGERTGQTGPFDRDADIIEAEFSEIDDGDDVAENSGGATDRPGAIKKDPNL
jgi:UPF0716 protein FxsA